MRTAITITYLLTMATAIAVVWAYQPPTDNSTALFAALGIAWVLALPWSLLTLAAAWWFMHEYAEPIFLGFFGLCGLLNALLLNVGRIRNRIELCRYNRSTLKTP